ncbi:GlxA family transcriptional regulator [Pseudomonas sp. DSP3-2-2]|uniref:GlxA family transcriptional regulator n=1 Tax=unclassified Pseudomonas TaxID=196821 RepID=UPI003CF04214
MKAEPAPRTVVLHKVVILMYPGAYTDDALRLVETLAALNAHAPRTEDHKVIHTAQIYSLSHQALNTFETATPSSESCSAATHSDTRTIDTLIILDGLPGSVAQLPQDALAWLRTTTPQVSRVVALGAGVFWLAAAGLLDQRRVTTHSALESSLASRFPQLLVEPQQGLQVDGQFYTTSERINASDMIMLLLRNESSHIPSVQAGLTEHAPLLHALATTHSVTGKVCAWWLMRIADDLSMERSALTLHMSERNFRRHFKQETGYPPYLFLLLLRLELARQALLDCDLPVDKIARRAGLLDGQQLARVFRKYLGVSPLEYRRKMKQGWTPKCHPDYARLFDARRPPEWLIQLQYHRTILPTRLSDERAHHPAASPVQRANFLPHSAS